MTAEKIQAVPENLQGIIITDCHDPNARARQEVNFHRLFGLRPTFIGLGKDNPDLEAAGHLVDVLDDANLPEAFAATPTVVLVNVAPRGDDVKQQWENGTPFCHFKTGASTVFSTYDGRALSLVGKLDLADSVNLHDIPTVTGSLAADGILSEKQAGAINNTQFRSKDFLPLAARLVIGGVELPAERQELADNSGVGGRAWLVDNFGNIKTTILPGDIEFEEGRTVNLIRGQEVVCRERLADVPTGELGVTIGSSGYGENRWLEVVVQKGSAAGELGVQVGSRVLPRAVTLV